MNRDALLIILGLDAALSVLLFGLYGRDKRAAQRGARRTPEATLHTVALLGGWPGGLAGQRVFRHKTRKTSFQLAFWCTVVVNCLASVWILST